MADINERLSNWIAKALKEHHADEIQYGQQSRSKRNERKEVINNRLDKLYDDKLDGKIEENFYERKHSEYALELKEIENLETSSNDNRLKYFELGYNFYRLSQKAREIYKNSPVEDRRKLIKLIFNELTLEDSKVGYALALPFKLLSRAVESTNSSKLRKIAGDSLTWSSFLGQSS